MRVRYVHGTGGVIEIDPRNNELRIMLELLYIIKQMTDTRELDDMIVAITNSLEDPPNVLPVCGKCWKVIDSRIDQYTVEQGIHYHQRCLATH